MKRELLACTIGLGVLIGIGGELQDHTLAPETTLPAQEVHLPKDVKFVLPTPIPDVIPTPNLVTPMPTPPPSSFPKVELPSFPSELPAAVAKYQNDVVRIAIHGPSHGSGMIIGSDKRMATVMTAGHMIMNDNNTLNIDSAMCGNAQVEAVSAAADRTGATNELIYGESLPSEQMVGSFVGPDDTSNVPDIALLRVNDIYDTLPQAVPITISSANVAVGSLVFFMNYQPTAGNNTRSPYSLDLDTDAAEEGYTAPAEGVGYIVKKMPNGDLMMVSGFRGYGFVGDDCSRPGSSGGPVFDKSGKLVGISVYGTTVSLPVLMAEEQDLHVDLVGLAPDKKICWEKIQPVTARLLDQLTTQLDSAPACMPKKEQAQSSR